MVTEDGKDPDVRIDERLVERLVRTQFPRWADLPVEPVVGGGWDNRTFRLGKDLCVRLPSAARYSGQVAKEHRWLPRLRPNLPRPVPVPVAMGEPAVGYPWHWSVYRWLDGETAAVGRIDDPVRFATDLGRFLAALQGADPAGGPPPGPHNFFRGGPLSVYDAETRAAIEVLGDSISADAASAAWEAARETAWRGPPVWLHGDVSAANLLVREGRLSAVIDFGNLAVGDPACDLAIAWTRFSGGSRKAFGEALPLDEGTWSRGRGWALWKALITLAEHRDTDPAKAATARHVIGEVLSDPPNPL